jgi:hypothetical protein
MYVNGVKCNSLLTRELEATKRDSSALAQLTGLLIAQLTLRKRNEKVSKDITNTNTADQSAYTSDSLRTGLATGEQLSALRFNDALSRLIPPRSRSDRTCFRNVANWLVDGCSGGRFTDDIFERVLDYARQARQGDNPAAVFMSILKEELGYEKKGKS